VGHLFMVLRDLNITVCWGIFFSYLCMGVDSGSLLRDLFSVRGGSVRFTDILYLSFPAVLLWPSGQGRVRASPLGVPALRPRPHAARARGLPLPARATRPPRRCPLPPLHAAPA
jgi:hypothetical protein